MPMDPKERLTAARDAWNQYQMASTLASDPKFGKAKVAARMALNTADPNSLASQVLTGMGENPAEYTPGALVGKGIKSLAQLAKK